MKKKFEPFKREYIMTRSEPRVPRVVKDPYKNKTDQERIDGLLGKKNKADIIRFLGEERLDDVVKKIVELKAIKIKVVEPKSDSMNVYPYRVLFYCADDADIAVYSLGAKIDDINVLMEYEDLLDNFSGMWNFWGIKCFIKEKTFYGFYPEEDYSKYACIWSGIVGFKDKYLNNPDVIRYHYKKK